MNLKKIENSFWANFKAISRIPRASGNEEKIRLYLKQRAEKADCETFIDTCGNLMIRKPAAKGKENYPIFILQGHLDMVCEKIENSSHDFSKDPIELNFFQEKGERWLRAKETTLGADNGFALAVGLTLIEDKMIQTGALEFLFTVDEECGLTGACGVDAHFLKGNFLINLDSEEENEFCIGCAGGKTLFISKKWRSEERSTLSEKEMREGSFVEVVLSDFLGGHSGIDIDKKRENAFVVFSQILKKAGGNNLRIKKMSVEGRHNVIPTKASALLFLPQKKMKKIFLPKKIKEKELLAKLSIEKKVLNEGDFFLSKKASHRILKNLATLPFGVIRFSKKNKVVESSLNPAVLQVDEKKAKLEISFRSLIQKELDSESLKIRSKFIKNKWSVEENGVYPPWEPEFNSELIKKIQHEWKIFSEKEAHLKVIHAGLECGVLKEKLPHCRMISLGPDILEVHTPRERINVDSANRVLFFLYEILQKNFI